MDFHTLKTLGQIAGIGGIAIGAVILIFRDVIRKNIFPKLERNHAYNIIRIILILTWSIGVVGIIAYVYVKTKSNHEIISQINIPGGTGWVLLGDYDENLNKFVRGPFFKVTDTKYPNDTIFPRKGEWIILTKEREIVIADYKISGTTKWNVAPWQQNILDSNDYTDIVLPKGTELEVRDVSIGHFEAMPFVVWVRVSQVPQ